MIFPNGYMVRESASRLANRYLLLCLVVACSAVSGTFQVALFSAEGQERGVSTDALSKGVIARSEAVFSGQIGYHHQGGFSDKNTLTKDWEHMVVFSGSSWRLDYKYDASKVPVKLPESKKDSKVEPSRLQGEGEIIKVSHRGKFVEYRRTPQSDGSVRYTARIAGEQSIAPKTGSPPVFAGSFWFECTKRFVQDNKAKVVRGAASVVHGIPTEVLEWRVAEQEKYKAFHSVNNLTDHGGLLRVHVAPQLGYVLPRIEYVSPSGTVATSFESSVFQEYAGGIFIPKRLSMQYYTEKGPGFIMNYELTEVKRINEPIPDREFVLDLPVGTHVADARPVTHSIPFEIKEKGPLPAGLEGLEDIITTSPPPFWGRNWHTALLVGAGVAVGLVGCGFFLRRFLKRRQKA